MPSRQEKLIKGNYYHVFNRGVNRETIFFSHENYIYCLRLMKKYAKAYSITLIAYCLMPNHYHFLLRQDGDVSLGKFINVLFNVYVQAVNRKQGRKGTLFGGRFKCIHITRNEYLIHLCRYIHFNPVEAGIIASPEDWIYSNYRDWIGLRKGTLIDRDFILAYFQSPEEYRKFVIEYQLEKEIQQALSRYYLD